MRTIAVSVGRTATLEIKGQPVHTAILKEPCAGPVAVTRNGVAGNEVAVHTDPVYAIAHEHYAYWAEALGVAPDAWHAGHFGENLTIAGLDERSLRLGDRVRIGGELELVVAGPRVPCFKLAWRLRQPDAFVQRFAASGRTGVYFGVAREGTVQAGDAAAVVARSQHPTVAEIGTMIFGADDPPVETLRAVLASPHLSATVALALRNRLYGILDVVETRRDRWRGWRRLRISRTTDETDDVRSFDLVAEDDAPLPRFRAGQFLTLRVPVGDGSTVERTWSLSDFEERPERYRISVRATGGAGSTWLHSVAATGTSVEARPPSGRFVLDRGTFRPVILVGAGIGLTPLIAMAKSHLARGADAPQLHLVCCVRDGAHLPFRDELAALDRAGARVSRVYSRPRAEDVASGECTAQGRLDLATLERLLGDTHILHGGRRIELPWYDCDVYLCGPHAFESALVDAAGRRGIDRARIRTESFAAVAASGVRGGVERARVRLARSNATFDWDAAQDGALLEFLESRGVVPDSGCRAGLCHACRCGLVAGTVAHDVVTSGLGARDVLLCRARPASAELTLDL